VWVLVYSNSFCIYFLLGVVIYRANLYQKLEVIMLRYFFFLFFISITFAQTWEFVGLDSMVIYNLQVKGDSIWAGTRDISINNNSGLYFSTDRGNSWIRLDSSLGPGSVIFFTIDETNSAIIYMIKGSSQYSRYGDIFKTTNSGSTWITLNSPPGFGVSYFIVSPLDSSEFYVVDNTIGHEWSTLQLFYKSTNSGESWAFKCCPGDQEHGIFMTFTMDKFDASVLYISAASLHALVIRSTDRGENWENVAGQPGSRIFSDSFIQNR